LNRYKWCEITEKEKPVWISIPHRQGSNQGNCLFGTGATAGTSATSYGYWWSRRTDLHSTETDSSLCIVGCQSKLRLCNNHGRNRGCQNKHHDQEEHDRLCAFHREPPFVKMEGSFCGAPNQSPDFSRHATVPLYWLIMFFLLANLTLVYNKQSHLCALSTRKVCAGSRANRSKK